VPVSDPDERLSPYVVLDRPEWARLRAATPLTLDRDDLDRLQGVGDPVDLQEVVEVYLPLARLLGLHVAAGHGLRATTSAFLGRPPVPTPFVLGIAGSVAVGKSTTARILRELLAARPSSPRVELLTTDGFLLPNAELERRGILARKGFPESYDQRGLLRFIAAVKSGAEEVSAPVYSHLTYDIVPGARTLVCSPDVLIVEGLNVLQPARSRPGGGSAVAIADFFDASVFVDARLEDVRRWYVERFLTLRSTAFADPTSYFHRFGSLSDDEAVETAEQIWKEVNEANYLNHILPTRGRATITLHKRADHAVERVSLRHI
jgi:type I pantothenate kinase